MCLWSGRHTQTHMSVRSKTQTPSSAVCTMLYITLLSPITHHLDHLPSPPHPHQFTTHPSYDDLMAAGIIERLEWPFGTVYPSVYYVVQGVQSPAALGRAVYRARSRACALRGRLAFVHEVTHVEYTCGERGGGGSG